MKDKVMSTAVVHDPIILNNRPLSANSAYHTVLLKLKWWIRTVCAVDLPSNAGRKGTETRLTEAEHNKEPLRNFFVKVKKGKLVGAKRQRGFLLWTCSDESQACPHAKRPLVRRFQKSGSDLGYQHVTQCRLDLMLHMQTSASFPAVKAVTSQLRSKQLAMLTEEEREQVLLLTLISLAKHTLMSTSEDKTTHAGQGALQRVGRCSAGSQAA